MALPLRPLELKQLFDFAIRIYRANFAPMVLLTALLQAPLSVVMTLFLYHFTTLVNQLQPDPLTEPAAPDEVPDPETLFTQNADLWLLIGGLFLATAVYQLLVLPLVHVATSRLAAGTVLGQSCTVREALAYAGKRYWPTQIALAAFLLPLLVIALLALLPVAALSGGDPAEMMIALLGSMGFIWVAGMATVAFYFRFFPAMTGAVQAVEDPPLHVRGAGAQGLWYLKRSFGLTARHYWRMVGYLLLLWMALGFVQNGAGESVRLLVWLAWLPTNMPGGSGEEQFAAAMTSMNHPTVIAWSMAITSLLGLLTPALIICYQTLLYFDLRFRKEGLDLELLLEDTPRPPAPEMRYPEPHVGV
jgi:hypothetical protein